MEPIYLFLCEDLDQAARVAGSYYLRTKSRQFLVVTDPDLKNSIDKAVFYKYDPNTNVLVPSYSKLFQPDD